jgi:hypothetical protein
MSQSVKAASRINLASLAATPYPTIDGYLVAPGDEILLPNQTTIVENGTYVSGEDHKLVRSTGWSMPSGSTFFVENGDTYAKRTFRVQSGGIVGTDPLVFAASDTKGTVADAVYYVSKAPGAVDTNDGLSMGTAFATIAAALKALGTAPGVIQLGPGLFQAPSYGIALLTRQALHGAGAQATIILGDLVTAPSAAVVSLTGSRSACRDLWITFVQPNNTGLRVTNTYPKWTPGTPYGVGRLASNLDPLPTPVWRIYQCIGAGVSGATGPTTQGSNILDNGVMWAYVKPAAFSAQNVRVDTIFIDKLQQATVGQHTIAFGIGDDTSGDVSEVCLIGCRSNGNTDAQPNAIATSIHMKLGNGASGNVLDISNFGGAAAGHKYGVMLNGAPLVSRGLNFGQSTEADINVHRTSVGTTSIVGGRSENSKRFIVSDFGAAAVAIRIADYTVVALRNHDGRGVQWLNAPLTLDNVALMGFECPQYVWINRVGVDNDVQAVVSARNLATDHPHPFQSPWAHPGVTIHSESTRFIGDSANIVLSNRRKTEHWTRRKIITSANPYSLDPANFEAVDIRLCSNKTDAGPFTLKPGVLGQRVSICFEQDGVGGRSYEWPTLCAFSGAVPAKVMTPRNRQTCEFRWTGRFWEQHGTVTNVTPPTIPPIPFTSDNFSSVSPNWLNTTTPPGTYAWEHVPGGGSLGIVGVPAPNHCKCQVLGWFGDKDSDVNNGFCFNAAAGAVIETGMTTTPTGISATFTWHATEGIIANYLDDMTFVVFFLTATHLKVFPFSNAIPLGSMTFIQPLGGPGTPLVPGSTHTLLVKITANGYAVTLDPGGAITIGGLPTFPINNPAELPLVKDLTRHGIVAGSTSATFTKFSVS